MANPRSLVLDAAPLVLLAADDRRADKLKRISAFGSMGHKALAQFVSRYDRLIATPHAMTEAWNMTGNDDDKNILVRETRLRLASLLDNAVERFDAYASVRTHPHFLTLGLSDVAQMLAAQHFAALLVTADRTLGQIALAHGVEAIHLTDLLEASPDRKRAKSNRRRG